MILEPVAFYAYVETASELEELQSRCVERLRQLGWSGTQLRRYVDKRPSGKRSSLRTLLSETDRYTIITTSAGQLSTDHATREKIRSVLYARGARLICCDEMH